MTSSICGVLVDSQLAEEWVKHNLKNSSPISKLVGERLGAGGLSIVFTDELIQYVGTPDLEHGIGLSRTRSLEVAKRFFVSTFRASGVILMIEDDLRRPNTDFPEFESFDLAGHVLRWLSLDGNIELAMSLLKRGSSDYPLNAFVFEMEMTDFQEAVENSEDDELADRISRCAKYVIVSAFDGESYLVRQIH